MNIPEDIKAAARRVVDPFLHSRGPIDGFALDYAVAAAIFAERERCAKVAKEIAKMHWDIYADTSRPDDQRGRIAARAKTAERIAFDIENP